MKLTNDAKLIAAVLVAGAAGLWWITRQGAAQSLARGTVGAIEGAAVGAVEGIGSALGIPQTNADRCAQAKAARNWWDMSFYCPAGDYAAESAKTFGNTAGAVISEGVLAIGSAVGIPRTSKTKCQQDLDAGRWLDASFSCPAGTFIGSVFGSTAVNESEAETQRLMSHRYTGGASGGW